MSTCSRGRYRFTGVAAVAGVLFLTLARDCQAETPATLVWDGGHLAEIRGNTEQQPEAIRDSLRQLRTAADEAMGRGPYSVVNKEITPPSGNKHDYMSFSRYWWPNPDTADGLPYIRRDGLVNHKLLSRGDRNRIGMLYEDFEALALAAYLLNDSDSAEHARRLLLAWFLDPETSMEPNLKYAQAVPGVAEGRSPGVIDTRHFLRIIDGVYLLAELNELKPQDIERLESWFAEYLDWLMTSKLGQGERRARNNHGAWFAAQAAGVALFIGREDIARELIEEARDLRVTETIEASGRMPEELKRTRSLHYSLFSLSAYATIARLGEHLGYDLWRHPEGEEARLRKALDYAGPYILDQESWPHPMIARYAVSDRQSQLLYLAASRYHEPEYLRYVKEAPKRFNNRHLTPLLFSTANRQSRVE